MDRARIQRLAQCALLGALALVLSYLETMIPLPVGIPGIKLGLANAAVLFALLLVDTRAAASIAAIKVLASGFLFGTPTMLAYSAGGTVCALAIMVAMSRIEGLGAAPISMASAIGHNAGQLAVASAMLASPAVFATLPVLAAAACVTGALVGIAVQGVVNALEAPKDAERKLIDLSALAFAPGEHVAFVGANGSGKSTAALQLAGLLTAADAEGDAGNAGARLVMQDPAAQVVKSQAEDDVAFGPENLGIPVDEMRELVARAMGDMGVEHLAERDVNELSGGQCQQLAIAGVLAMCPQMLVFDEATSQLDEAARKRFAALVAKLTSAGVTVVTVTQLPAEALAADRAVLFENSAVAFIGKPDEALERMGLEAAKTAEDAPRRQTADAPAASTDDNRCLRCDDITFAYPGCSSAVLAGVSLTLRPGEVIGLTGPCGSGKSTLAQLLAGYALPSRGTVTVDGLQSSATPSTQSALRRKVAYVEQRPERALFAQSAFEDVLFGAHNLGLDEQEADRRAQAALEAVGIDVSRARETSPFSYSGGEQRRIALAGMFVLDTPYLVLDEPSAGLDPAQAKRLARLIEDLHKRGKGIVVISHDELLLDTCCTRVIELEKLSASTGDKAGADKPQRPPARFGRYVAGDSPMHRLDARVKFTACLLFMLAGFAAQGWAALSLVALAGLATLLSARMSARQAWAGFRPFVGLALFVAVFDTLFTSGQTVLWQAGPLCVSLEGIAFAAESVVRLALVATVTSTLMATTSATQLSNACEALLKPLQGKGLRADDLGLSLDMTLRFVPLVQSELLEVKRAQQARLAPFDAGSLPQRVRAYLPVLVPLFAACLRRSEDLALAIQNRAYGACPKRTCYRTMRLSHADAAALACSLALLAAVIVLRVIG